MNHQITLKNIKTFDLNIINKKYSSTYKYSTYWSKAINKINLFNLIYFLSIIYLITLIKSNEQVISLQINETGSIQILGIMKNDSRFPDKIYINNILNSDKNNIYNFTNNQKKINIIKLVWSKEFEDLSFLFAKCKNIIEIDFSNFDTSKVISMDYMFNGCSSLTSLNLSNFYTSKVISMDYMFSGCSSLISLNLSNFDTSEVISMDYMFNGCSSLTSLNLSNFKTSKVIAMKFMFGSCSSLLYLNLSSFDTSQANDIGALFYGCKKLTSVNLSSFKTSKVIKMNAVFMFCSSLISVDLSNFDTINVIDMFRFFKDCSSLKYLDLSNFKTPNVGNMGDMFYGCSNLQYLKISNFDTSKVTTMTGMFALCSSLVSLDLSSFNTSKVTEMDVMFKDCIKLRKLNLSNFDTSNLKSMKYMFYNCFSLESLNIITFNISKIEKYFSLFSIVAKNIDIKTKDENIKLYLSQCNTTFLCLNGSIVDIEKENNNSLVKYFLNCTDQYNSFDFKYGFYFRFEEDNIKYNKYNICDIAGTLKNLDDDIEEKDYFTQKMDININYYYNETNKSYINISEIVINKTNNIINDFDESYLNERKQIELNLEFEQENITILLTTTDNEKNKEKENESTINLKECEAKIKFNYNIENKTLYLIKIIKPENGMKIPKTEYEIFYYEEKLTKLNLSFVKGCEIDITNPVKINDAIEKYDPNSDYYNNICYKTKSKSGTDITLLDRKREFITNNMTLCEENCKFIGYNKTLKKVKCSCGIKINLPLMENIIFNKDILYKSFSDFQNILNIKILKCYKYVFVKNDIIKNYAIYICSAIFALFFICLIIFYYKINSLSMIINNIKKEKIKISKSNDKGIFNNIKRKNKKNNTSNNKQENNKINKLEFKKSKNSKNFPPIRKQCKSIIIKSDSSFKILKNKNNVKLIYLII